MLLILCIVSCGFGTACVMRAIAFRNDSDRGKLRLTPIQMITVGVFLALLAILLPLYYHTDEFPSEGIVRPVMTAILHALRVFILDGDFDFVIKTIGEHSPIVTVGFLSYVGLLYLIAPLMTISNIMSLFKNFWDALRYRFVWFRNVYILSELNKKSVALAKSIRNDHLKAAIVFADVLERNGETDAELLRQADELKAICLKRDISSVNFLSKKGIVELFLISNDESQNVSQAVKITTAINRHCPKKGEKKRNIKIFTFSTQPSAPYIIDSIKYDNLVARSGEYGEESFKLRRINEKQQLIWNTVPKMKVFEIADRHEKTLSVMIVGFGNYGKEFFKMLAWYCQFEGYQLQINIIDKQGNPEKAKNDLEALINRECPELLKKNRCTAAGEAHYDIEAYAGVDVKSSDLDELLLYDGSEQEKIETANRLKRTNLVIVALGDDDINIEISIRLRSLFDRVNGVKANKKFDWKDEVVEIYSIVYDDQKCSILYNEESADRDARILVNHKDIPYHIHFIGSMSSQYNYHNIYDAQLEKSAYDHHTGWVDIEERIYNEWLANDDFANLDNHEWHFHYEKTDEAAECARKKYEQFEYYRLSSIAKELYQREIKNNEGLRAATVCTEDGKQTCQCENCIRRKRSEHMRWNAYTRTIGFSFKENGRADRAMLHDNLCEWHQLPPIERLKD